MFGTFLFEGGQFFTTTIFPGSSFVIERLAVGDEFGGDLGGQLLAKRFPLDFPALSQLVADRRRLLLVLLDPLAELAFLVVERFPFGVDCLPVAGKLGKNRLANRLLLLRKPRPLGIEGRLLLFQLGDQFFAASQTQRQLRFFSGQSRLALLKLLPGGLVGEAAAPPFPIERRELLAKGPFPPVQFLFAPVELL